MKKLTVMLLIAAMVLGVSACGNSANKEIQQQSRRCQRRKQKIWMQRLMN